MFTRVTIQGSLVALQQHIRSKAPATTRERSHSLDDTANSAIDQRPLSVGNEHQPSQHSGYPHQFVAPTSVAVDYLAGWGATTTPSKARDHDDVSQTSEEEVIISYDNVTANEAPSATYHYGSREVVVYNVCSFLELWLNSSKHNVGNFNPHGWECLRKQKALTPDGIPSCQSNSYNNYNTAHASCGHPHHYLYGTTIPTIAMKDYLMRLTEYFRTTDAVFIIAAQYFSRVVEAHNEKQASLSPSDQYSLITPWSLHRIYFTCCVLAAKWLEDTPFDNQYYASVGGISTFELSNVETALLSLLDFNIFISTEAVNDAWESLQKISLGGNGGTLALPLGSSSQTSSSSCQLSVTAAPFRPNAVSPANTSWYRGSSAPVFPYQNGYSHYYSYGQHQVASIVGGYAQAY